MIHFETLASTRKCPFSVDKGKCLGAECMLWQRVKDFEDMPQLNSGYCRMGQLPLGIANNVKIDVTPFEEKEQSENKEKLGALTKRIMQRSGKEDNDTCTDTR